MVLRKMIIAVALAVSVLFAGTAVYAQSALDQRALDMLKGMSDTLASAKTMSFKAVSMVPIREPGGMWISLFGSSRVIREGKEKMFAETRGDFFPYDFYYDGKSLTAYAPTKNVYAVRQEPGTLDLVIDKAYKEEGGSFPYADILIARPYDVLAKGLLEAKYVGQSTIAGVKTDHLAFRNHGVAWQIWIGVDDKLPRMVNATYLDADDEPSYTVQFSDWKLDEPVPPETFVFANTTQASPIEFRAPTRVAPQPAAVAGNK